jgi:hypothetical protein
VTRLGDRRRRLEVDTGRAGWFAAATSGRPNTGLGTRRGQPSCGGHQFLSGIGAVNPSLTAIANASRIGDRLADWFG